MGLLRRKSEHRFTSPGAGPEAPVTDLLVHGLDIRRPLGIDREIPADRARTSLDWLNTRTAKSLVVDGVIAELRFEVSEFAWTHGDGPVVRGDAASLLSALTGHATDPNELEGSGVESRRSRTG